jgi:hypothetical protein
LQTSVYKRNYRISRRKNNNCRSGAWSKRSGGTPKGRSGATATLTIQTAVILGYRKKGCPIMTDSKKKV